MSGWFQAQVVHTGRLPLFCFFVAFVAGFGCIRLSVRLVRAQVRWWPGNFRAGSVHIHHMVFGVVFMGVGGVAELAAPLHSLAWRSVPAAVFGLGTALVLDEFALILHLRDVYWTNEGRISVDAVFVAMGVTALLLIGVSPVGVSSVADDYACPAARPRPPPSSLTVVVLFVLAGITLLKGKIWTALLGLFVPPVVRRRRHPPRQARLAVGPLALPAAAGQARQGHPARAAPAPAGDPREDPRPGPAHGQPQRASPLGRARACGRARVSGSARAAASRSGPATLLSLL